MRMRDMAFPNLIAVPMTVLLLTACSSYEGTNIRSEPSFTCDDALATVVHRVRSGDTAGGINSELDWLGDNCVAAYDIFVDYASAKSMAEQFGPDTCASLTQYIGRESITLLSEDGLCSGAADEPLADAPAVGIQPGGGIAWNEAVNYVGTTQRVCGPLSGTGKSNDDVFLNLGRDYPDPERFQIVLWDIGSLEPIPYGATLCTSGQITLYEGLAQIELHSASLVEIYE